MKVRLSLLIICSLICSCNEKEFIESFDNNRLHVDVESMAYDDTKTVFCADNPSAFWKMEDYIGVIALYDNSPTDSYFQPFDIKKSIHTSDKLLNARFRGELTSKGFGTYQFISVSPYEAWMSADDLSVFSSRLQDRQYPELHSWDGSCDIMVSKPETYENVSDEITDARFRFYRLFGFLRLIWADSLTELFGDELLETVSIEGSDSDILAGKFTVDLLSENRVSPVMDSDSQETTNKVVLDYRARNIKLSDVDAYFVLNPGEYSKVTITVCTNGHKITLTRNNLMIEAGALSSAKVNWDSEKDLSESRIPLLPENPGQLKVLTFGHSYVQDSMQWINGLLDNAGITNVTFAYFYISGCKIGQYYERSQSSGNTIGGTDKITYRKHYYNGTKMTVNNTSKTIIEGLLDEEWDAIIFQTGPWDEGKYYIYKDDLHSMLEYVRLSLYENQRKIPVFGWHMFWPHEFTTKSPYASEYYGSQEVMYASNVQSTKSIISAEGIELIIPTGTAVQNVRHSILNNEYGITRDYGHLDIGVGCYTASCTWFETFVKPCFGVSVMNNGYVPEEYTYLKVTNENKEMLQKAAVMACNNPFETSHLDVIENYQVGCDNQEYIKNQDIEF